MKGLVSTIAIRPQISSSGKETKTSLPAFLRLRGDFSSGRSDWQKRLLGMLLGMLDGMPDTQSEAGHLIHIRGEKELALDGELANEVRRRQLDFLIVDSASFSVSKTSDAEAVNAFFGQLGRLGWS